ncbi:dehydrogenase [Ahniella affigens]|uniref:Dehydrogenase n=1 Tax=Ahniella affigens TaxID=2021234 RepID=A0A2P1PQB5_9GAMM|nr:molybdopterin-dependent oxidoreductase [Ahniella affigens]AVP97035.1 dehydrogenase [Ahniella affigens]
MTASLHKTACPLCSRNCGITVEVEQGKLGKIRGDDAHPNTRGYMCQKAARLAYYQEHRERLREPLKRREDGSFEAISWEQALSEIAAKLSKIRDQHGGDAFAFVGGGGQGNHLGAVYSASQLCKAMGSRYIYNSLGQEKTPDFWLNGRLFGDQRCHTTEDVEHADFVLFIGCNPFQSHGIANARDTLRALRKSADRTMVVIDPRRTETAEQADVHLQLRPGTDAFLMAAMLAIMLRDGLLDREFIALHCTGFEQIEPLLAAVPIEDYVRRADVPLAEVEAVAQGFARAKSACVRIDLGIQHTLHTTLNGYLEKLLYLLTGNFGKRGGNNLHTFLLPILGHTDERVQKRGRPLKRTQYHQMFPIAGVLPPNILPDEILKAGEKRVRAVFVDSSNPLLTYADTDAYRRAFAALELLVTVDVAMTETARASHYVLPAASQFEKWEAAGFTFEFPDNFFHLRAPLLPATGDALPEAEIYTRLLEAMGLIPKSMPWLRRIARFEPGFTNHLVYLGALGVVLSRHRSWRDFAASILYRTLGPSLRNGAAAAAPLLPLAKMFVDRYGEAVARAGFDGPVWTRAAKLFAGILSSDSGLMISRHTHEEVWSLLATADRKVHLAIPEMLGDLAALQRESEPTPDEAYPFVLMAGERRSYNANQILRDPAWRKVDPDGALRIHPDDAAALSLHDGGLAQCESRRGRIVVSVSIDASVRRGVVSLPHGYGMEIETGQQIGPAINRLTASDDCDPFTKTPYHKHVRVALCAIQSDASAA